MTTERADVQFGTTSIPFAIRRSARRATVSLSVERGALVVSAPVDVPVARLCEVVRSRGLWVKARLAQTTAVDEPPPREFVSGETFRFLGRQRRLQVVELGCFVDQAYWQAAKHFPPTLMPAALKGDTLAVLRAGLPAYDADATLAADVRASLQWWFRTQAAARLPRRVAVWAARLGMPMPEVLVRTQRRRWGSCDRAGQIRLNWRLVQAPTSLIDYVVTHELVHLQRADEGHGPAFWSALGRVMPDYDTRRDRLRQLGPSLEW